MNEPLKKRVLIVSPYFPPSTVAGVHRARILANHLPRWGWEPIIFCVHERYHEQELDPDLASLVEPGTRVIQVRAWPTRLCRPLGLGDLGIRGYHYLKQAVKHFLRTEGGELLFITALPGFPTRMGPGIKRQYRVPFIVDYQDPWLPQGYETATPLTKRWLAHQIAAHSEPQILPQADHITTVSEGTSGLIAARYPFLPSSRFTAIPIGGDTADYAFLRHHQRPCLWLKRAPGIINVCYVGNVWTRAFRTLHAVFAALGELRRTMPDLYHRLRLTFVGTSNQPLASAREIVMPAARAAGISECVHEIPGRVPYLDALNLLLHADILLLIGSDEPHYTASKLYPVLLAGRPVFGVFHERSSVCQILRETGGGQIITFGDHSPVETKTAEIACALKTVAFHPESVAPVDHARLAPYLGPTIARRFAEVFNHVV